MPNRAVVIDLCSDSDSSGDFPSSPFTRNAPRPVLKIESVSPRPKARRASPAVKASPKEESSRLQVQFTAHSQTTPSRKSNKSVKRERPSPNRPPAQPQQQETVPFSTILDSLNKAQRRAVTSHTNTVAILAGPGSGKTHTLTSRVVWLIDQIGYQPRDIIVATFTVKAAREMKERIGKVLGDGREKKIVLGTFHSVSRRYLATYGKRIGLDPKFSIIDDGDSRAIITRIVKRLDLATDLSGARAWISKKKTGHFTGDGQKEQQKKTWQSSDGGNSSAKSDFYKNLDLIYAEYQAHLESMNLLDYDDLLVKCAELLRKHPSCVFNVEAVLIDEYQDTNGIQFELMKLFAQARNRITVVGDPDQSIYGWRSADYTNLSRFLQDFPDTAEISLEENYRSSQRILDTSLQVIQQDQNRYQKILLPIHKRGTLPVLRTLSDGTTEADWIVGEIRRAMQMTGGLLNHNDVAILVRSASLSRPIETALGSCGVPYRMIGGHRFFDRAEVKVLVDYLRIVHQPHNNDALMRIINVPRRGIGDKRLKALLDEAETDKISLWTLITQHCRGERTSKTGIQRAEKKIGKFIAMIGNLQGRAELVDEDEEEDGMKHEEATTAESLAPTKKKPLTLIELIETLLDRLQFQTFIKDKYGGDEESRWANVKEFVKLAREFTNDAKATQEEDDLPEVDGVEQTIERGILGKFLANVTLAADPEKKKNAADGKDEPMVTISTIHAAKGLEWPVVFIPAAYDGSIPHSRSEDCDEERRLLYVAMTRAKCLLNISYAEKGFFAKGGDEQNEQELSVFLSSVPASSFAERGPSYNRDLLEDMGDILRRRVPTDQEIFKSLPMGMILEDDQYPIEPSQKHSDDRNADGGDGYGRWGSGSGGSYGSGSYGQASKKRRQYLLQTPDYTGGGSAANLGNFGARSDSAGPGAWNNSNSRPYATTMDGAGSFPGFTTATVHQATMQAAAEAERTNEALAKQSAAKAKRAAAALRGGQQTIMQSFVRSHSNPEQARDSDDDVQLLSAVTVLGPASRSARAVQNVPQVPGMMSAYQSHQIRPAGAPRPGSIPPELTTRKLGLPRMNIGHPAISRAPSSIKANNDDGASSLGSAKRYAHFSSSPPRGEKQAAAKQEQQQQPVPPQPFHTMPRQQYHNHTIPGRVSYPTPSRPAPAGKENQGSGGLPTFTKAASFHATTFAQASSLGQPGSRKRPASSISGGGSIAPMDKLRMPFKPPSIKRPQ